MKNYFFQCFLLLSLLISVSMKAENVVINTSLDTLYVYDDFAIKGKDLTDTNGNTGWGWSESWLYQNKSSGVSIGDEYIYCTKSSLGIIRSVSNPINFVGSTYYVSFLFKKNETGNFRISGCRASDLVDRLGIHIKDDGKLGAQAGVSYANTVFSNNSFVDNDKTYLVVAKYFYTTKPNINISVFSVDDAVPVDEPTTWDLEVEGSATGMVAIEYFRLAFTTDEVMIDEFKVADTWKSATDTEIEYAFPVSEVANSEVQSINQISTSEANSWTYEVDEAGDYQIAYAWIWVDGEDKAVDLEVMIGDSVVKSFRAESAIAPYRFETRLQDLKQGDVLRVRATPYSGASYQLNYRLAYGTPTFLGLSTFTVSDYGAVGDGVTNDYQAIHEAVIAAEKNGGVVSFDGSKTYYVKGPENYALFDLYNKENIKVEGNGAEIIMYPTGNFIRMDNVENIQIDGFTTTYNPLPYYQGEITNINVENLYLDMQVETRYEKPLTGKYVDKFNIFGRSFWVTIPGTKMGEGRHLSVDSTSTIGDDEYAIRVFFQDHETADLQYSKDQNASHYIIPHRDYGHEALGYRDSPYCAISRSSRVTISNIMTHSICHFAYNIGGNFGPISFINTDFLVPNEDDMHVAWRDGWHVWGNRYGILIQDGDFDAGYTYDDIFSPHSNVPIVESISGTNVRLQSKPAESYKKYTDKPLWQIGDLVSFWDEDQMVFYGMARVTDVLLVNGTSQIDIVLDREVPNAQSGAYAINEEIINRDMLVRNCTTTPRGRIVGVRQRTPILYQDCDFKNIHFWTYRGESWRTRPRQIAFDNCVINERTQFNVDDTWNISLKNCIIKAKEMSLSNCPRVVMDSIYFLEQSSDAIILRDASKAYVFGDYSYNEDPRALKDQYDKDISSVIAFSEPDIYPSYKPPFLFDEGAQDMLYADEPFDMLGDNLTNTGSGNGWDGNWYSSDVGISIDANTSLNYPQSIAISPIGGQILESGDLVSNGRLLESPISLASGAFYISFLAKKTVTGAFTFSLDNDESQSRFAVSIAADGRLIVRTGVVETSSNTFVFQNDLTYLVLVKYSNYGGANAIAKVKLYRRGDQIQEDENDIIWDVESMPAATGVDQNRVLLTIENGMVDFDELLIGNSIRSVTVDENYDSSNIPTSFFSTHEKLIINYKQNGVVVDIPQVGGLLTFYDMWGRQLSSQFVFSDSYFISDPILKSCTGIKLIRYTINDSVYIAKVIR